MMHAATFEPKREKRRPYGRWLVHIVVYIVAAAWLVPFWSPIVVPMKTTTEYFDTSTWTLPKDPANIFVNIASAWNTAGLGSGFFASLSYGIVGAAAAIFFASLGAFAITRLEIRAPFFWFFIVFAGTIVPFQMYLIPLFQSYNDLGLYDTWIGMALFYTAICIPFCLFVMRGTFSTISREVLEAAKLDGCSNFDVFWRICLSLAKGSIAVLFLFQFTWTWNDLIFGLVLSTSDGIRPIMPTLAGMQGQYSALGPPTVLAGALIASLPTMGLFILLRDFMIRGLTITAGVE